MTLTIEQKRQIVCRPLERAIARRRAGEIGDVDLQAVTMRTARLLDLLGIPPLVAIPAPAETSITAEERQAKIVHARIIQTMHEAGADL